MLRTEIMAVPCSCAQKILFTKGEWMDGWMIKWMGDCLNMTGWVGRRIFSLVNYQTMLFAKIIL